MNRGRNTHIFDLYWEDILVAHVLPYLNIRECFNFRCVSKACLRIVYIYLSKLKSLKLQNKELSPETFNVFVTSCTKLKYLNLSRCRTLTDAQIIPLLKGNSELVSLNLSKCENVTSKCLQPVILFCNNLRILKLSRCLWLTTGAMEALALHQNYLEDVDLGYCLTISESCVIIFIKKFRTIKILNLEGNKQITDKCLYSLSKYSKSLKHLNLAGCCEITDRGVRNHGIHPMHQLLLTLRFYALGTMLLSVADFVGVSKASACRIVRDVSYAIAQLYSKYIYMHNNTEEDFFCIARFPRVLGAIDGTHIRIQSPCSQIGEEFRNRKGYFSINVQAVCNAKLLLMNVVARWPGSAHDATIFNNSELRAQCESGLYSNKWLLGDSAYPLRPYLLTPISNPRTRGEQLYNDSHIRTRNCIERCFVVWKRRFPVVALTMRLSLLRANAVIIATAVLHNICIQNNLDDMPPEVEIPVAEAIHVVSHADDENHIERATLISDFFDKSLARHCPSLEGLVIKGCTKVTESSLHLLRNRVYIDRRPVPPVPLPVFVQI